MKRKTGLSLLVAVVMVCAAATGAFAAGSPDAARDLEPGQYVDECELVVTLHWNQHTMQPVTKRDLEKLLEKNGTPLLMMVSELGDDDVVGTGTICVADDPEEGAIGCMVVVPGDVNGTGKMTLAQLTRVAAAFTGARPLEPPFSWAADINGNGRIDLPDLTAIAAMYRTASTHVQETPPVPTPTPTLEPVDPSMWASQPAMANYLVSHRFGNASGQTLTFKRGDEAGWLDAYIDGQFDRTWSYKPPWESYSAYLEYAHVAITIEDNGDLVYGALDDGDFTRLPGTTGEPVTGPVGPSDWEGIDAMTSYLVSHKFENPSGHVLTFRKGSGHGRIDAYVDGQFDRTWAWHDSWEAFGAYYGDPDEGQAHVAIEIHDDGDITYGPTGNDYFRVE